MTLEELKVVITAETEDLRKGLKSVKEDVGKMASSVNKDTKKTSSGFAGLTKTIKGLAAAVAAVKLIQIGKQALQVASDLQEVQNVVDVAFGDMSAEIDAWAKTCLKQFGLSELSAKRAASTFMAMGNSMGISSETAKKMSINMSSLAADMASFYNTDYESMQSALEGIYTGNTRALRQYGIVVSEATLEQYRLEQGISKSYSAMSEAEKVQLRYNYVLKATANAQGDFARTSDSWANQVKLLKEQWSQLLSILGNGLIQVLTPLLKLLNNLLSSIIGIANSLASAFGGTAIKSATAGTESLAASAIDSSAAMKEENKAAKTLRKTLAGFDELNVFSSNNGSGSGAGGAGLGDFAGGVYATGVVDEEQMDPKLDKLKDFVKECKDILAGWTKDIPKLDIKFNTDEALADLKQLILNIVNIVGGVGNLVITLSINILNDIDIGAIIQKVITCGKEISNIASTLVDVLVPALKKLYNDNLKPIVQWIGNTLKDALDFVIERLRSFNEFIKKHTQGIQDWISVIGSLVSALWKVIEPIADAAWGVLKTTLGLILDIVEDLLGFFLDLGSVIKTAFTNPQQAVKDLKKLISELWTNLREDGAKAWESLKQTFSPAAAWFTSVWTKVKDGANNMWSSIKTTVSAMPSHFKNEATKAWNNMKTAFAPAGQWFNTLFTNIKNGAVTLNTGIKNTFKTIPDWFKTTFTQAWQNVKNVFSTGGKIFDGIKEGILEGLKTIVNAIIKGINKVVKIPFDGLNTALLKIKNADIFGIKPFKNLISTVKVPQIPLLAKGGVATDKTLAMIGEYAGAHSNPEIVTPQSILKETIDESNGNLASVLMQVARQIIKAIEDLEMIVNIGDDTVVRSAARGNEAYKRMTGKSLI